MCPDQPSLFDDFVSNRVKPHSDEEWGRLDATISDVFSPHGPIDEETLFAGRTDLMADIVDVVFQRGCHAVIFGERGVGKTSFANILRDKIFNRSQVVKVTKRSCTSSHNYRLIWQHVFDDITIEGKTSKEFIDDNTTAYEIFKIFDSYPPNQRPVIIIDEFDRVSDTNTFVQMADTIKYLADYSSKCTIIILGVGASIHELFGGHPSIHRNVRQKLMPKMDKRELSDLLMRRLPILNMTATGQVLAKIVDLSQGFPGYTHLLSQNAFRAAVKRHDIDVNMSDLKQSIIKSMERAEETIKEAYYKAVRSTKPNHQYREALLAFALTKTNEKGYFKAKDVKEPFSKVTGKNMDIPNFARHLQEFQGQDRGPVLLREGKPKSYEYRFVDPLLRPFAILAGLNEGFIQASDLS